MTSTPRCAPIARARWTPASASSGPIEIDGDLAAVALDELERQLEAVLVAGVEGALDPAAHQEVIGAERRGPLRVRHVLRADDHVHGGSLPGASAGLHGRSVYGSRHGWRRRSRRERRIRSAPSSLDGVTVADFSRVLAGPLATMLLADLGADVIKIERPDGGDDTRAWGPPWARRRGEQLLPRREPQQAERHAGPDRSGRSRRRRAALAGRADVVIENFRPGVMARFGLDEPTLRAERPALDLLPDPRHRARRRRRLRLPGAGGRRPDERHRRTRRRSR